MRKALLILLTVTFISSIGFAEMRLQLKSDLMSETNSSIINNDLKSNLKLEIPAEVVTPSADMHELVKGLMLLGILADVSFPMGSDDGFKHIAGTAWSAHLVFSYFVSPAFRITFRGGYINFGTQSESGGESGYTYNYEDTFSQIPLLIGGYYMIPTGSGFKPYIGLAIGLFFQTYKVNWTQEFGGLIEPYSLDASFTNTGFGVVPGLGAYYMAGSVLIQLAVEYTYVFSDLPTVEDSYDYSYLGKSAGIAQDETDTGSDDKPSYFSVLLGVSFPVGN